jgi:hypothetical protein
MFKLIKLILILVVILLAVVGGGLALLYDGSGDEELPFEVYDDNLDGKTLLFTELNNAITQIEDGDTSDLQMSINEDILNRYIYDQILEFNEFYSPGDGCNTPSECYIFAEGGTADEFEWGFHIVGAWVNLYAPESVTDLGRFVFNVYLEFDVAGFAYKTVLEVHFLFSDSADEYYLEFDKLQMGALPVPNSFFSSILSIAENQGNIDIEGQVGELPIGEFDLDTISYTLEKDEILTTLAESDSDNGTNMLLLQELLSIVFANQLVEIAIEDEALTLNVGISQISSDDDPEFPEYLYDLHDQEVVGTETIIGEFNPELFNAEEYLQDLFTEYVFSSALVGGTGFTIEEETFNKLVYFNANGFADARSFQEIPISDTETKQLEVGLKALWFEFFDESIEVHALFRIGSIDSLMLIDAEEVPTTDGTLQFTFTNITIGEDSGEDSTQYLALTDLSTLKQVFADLGDVQFGEFNQDGDLILSASRLTELLENGTNAGAVTVDDITLSAEGITLEITPNATYQAAFDAFTGAVEAVLGNSQLLTDLDTLLGDSPEETEILNTVTDIQTTLNGGGTISSEDVEELFNNLEDLDPETQDQFLDTITDLINPATLSGFEDFFGELGEESTGS